MKKLFSFLTLICLTVLSLQSFSQTLTFSTPRGFYTSTFQLTITKSFAGGVIRYTTNGTAPTTTSGTVYSGPITVSTTSLIRAIGYDGGTVTPVTTHSYLFLNDVIHQPATISGWPTNSYDLGNGGTAVQDYAMDQNIVTNGAYSGQIIQGLQSIPSMSIVMDKNEFWDTHDNDVEHPCSVEILYYANSSGNEQFDIGFEAHSWLRVKRSFRLTVTNTYATEIISNIFKTGPLNGETATNHFDHSKIVLRGGNNRSWARNWRPDRTCYTRDEWYRTSLNEVSGLGVHGNFVHLYINGIYWGLYNPVERPDAGWEREYMGGSYDDWLSMYHDGVRSGDDTRYKYFVQQLVYKDMSVPANYEEFKEYLDVEKYAEYIIVSWFTGMADWPGNNFYGGNRNIPVGPHMYYGWDCEWSWDNAGGARNGADVQNEFKSNVVSSPSLPEIAEVFHAGRQNSDFLMLLADRVYKHCFNNGALTDDNSRARWQTLNSYISTAIIAESARWGDAVGDGITRTKNNHWTPEVNRVDALMNGNVARFLVDLRSEGYYPTINPPTFNQEGGNVSSSFNLTMSNPNGSGTIYYTTNGVDPRASGGGIASGAQTYSGEIPVSAGLNIKARVKTSSEWSALHEGDYVVNGGVPVSNLFINEFVASNSAGIQDNAGEKEDWIEIYNANPFAVNLAGLYITDDLSNPTKYQIPSTNLTATTIPAGGFKLLWADEDLGQGELHVNIKLSTSGEAIGLAQNISGSVSFIDSFTFGLQATDTSAGRFPDGTNQWISFSTPTPGATNTLPFVSGIYINEFLASNINDTTDEAGDHEDWIEIYNDNNTPVNIGGFYISDNLANPLLFQLPTSNSVATTIPAKGFLLLWGDAELLEGPLHITPKLGKSGEAIVLTQVLYGSQKIIDSLTFGPQTDDISTGRFPDGADDMVAFSNTTPGASNSVTLISGLFINEFLASNVAGLTDEFGDHEDWIEIYNGNNSPVNVGGLYITDDLTNPLKAQISGANPTATTIPAHGFLLLWADDELGEGPTHISPKLGKGGEAIGLVQVQSGNPVFLDSLTFGVQVDDISTGLFPDGSANRITFASPTPGASNSLPFVSGLFINEFLTSNINGITDEAGDREDWIEIYNNNNTPVDIGGTYITDNFATPLLFQIPTGNPASIIPAKGFVILWADNELAEGPLHISPKLSKSGEAIALVQVLSGSQKFIDSLSFGPQTDDISAGRYNDGSINRTAFTITTPGQPNVLPLVNGLFINEFLASNVAGLLDEFGNNDDWFEIYNSNAFPVNIGGLYVTDDLLNPGKSQIPTSNPSLTTIPAGGFLLLWADEQQQQGPLHTGIKLGAGGEALALVQINGPQFIFIDSLTFGAQVADISQGRYPDGAPTNFSFSNTTPGSTNLLAPDCNGVPGGTAAVDDCGVCAGGNTGKIPNADKDDCGICNGNNASKDCFGVCGGTASLDGCNVCSGGTTGIVPNSTCCVQNEVVSFTLMHAGTAGQIGPLTNGMTINLFTIGSFSIRANVCSTPVGSVKFILNNVTKRTEATVPYSINGDSPTGNYTAWNPTVGSYTLVGRPYASSNGTGPSGVDEVVTFTVINQAVVNDCHGVPNGTAAVDQCGVCAGGTTGIVPNSNKDQCGVCSGNNAAKDCNGVCFGTAFLDGCGTCVGGTTGLAACTIDCNGMLNGTAAMDDCGVCAGGTTGRVPNANKDQCGVCNGNNAAKDCSGVCFGTASVDNCNVCSGGNTGIFPNSTCAPPCVQNEVVSFSLMREGTAGVIGPLTNGMTINLNTIGSFSIRANVCSTNVGSVKFVLNGTTKRTETTPPYALNGDSPVGNYTEWNPTVGSYTLTGIPYTGSNGSGTAGVSETVAFTVVNQNNVPDCAGVAGGSAHLNSCGSCVGGTTGLPETSGQDCSGACGGTAFFNACNVCIGGTTGLGQNAGKDCNGVCNGSATFDNCGVCSGGNTGITPNSTCTPSCVHLQVVSLTLMHNGNDGVIGPLTNGMVINKNVTGNFNVRADVCDTPVGSVRFTLNGSTYSTETTPPYALAGDNPVGSYKTWSVANGSHTLTATPYSSSGGNGTAGIPFIVSFTVIGGSSKTSLTTGVEEEKSVMDFEIYPNPNNGKFYMETSFEKETRLSLKIFNPVGQLVYEELTNKNAGDFTQEIDLGHLSSGVYLLQVKTSEYTINRKVVIR